MNHKIFFAALTGCVALAACAGGRTEQAQQRPASTEFTRDLASQYHGFSEQQRLEAWDYGAYNYFESKGDRAARGEVVPPETPGQRFTPRSADVTRELTGARQRLVTALEGGATTRAPAAAARAQVRYDCWLESTDDPTFAERGSWLNRKYQECRSEFEAAMAQVDAAMRPAPVAAPVPPAPPREQSFLVFFDFDRAEVTPQAEDVIRRAVDNYRRGGTTRITLVGHADRAGSPNYNQALSERRARAVEDALARAGVPATQVVMTARGETQPLVPTPDGVPEPQNRRVEISIQ